MNKIVIQKVDDWEACYIDGKLYEEGHELGEGCGMLGLLQDIDSIYDFNIQEIESYWVDGTDLEDYINTTGSFPEELKNHETWVWEENNA